MRDSADKNSPDKSEKILVYRVQLLDDHLAFSELVKMYQSRIRQFLFRYCQSWDKADDLSQETFMQAYHNIEQYEAKGSFGGWLFKIAFNFYLKDQEKEIRRKNLFLQNVEIIETSGSSNFEISTDSLDIDKVLNELPQLESIAISLNKTFGFSHAETSKIMGVPLGSVKSMIRNGLAKLTDELSD